MAQAGPELLPGAVGQHPARCPGHLHQGGQAGGSSLRSTPRATSPRAFTLSAHCRELRVAAAADPGPVRGPGRGHCGAEPGPVGDIWSNKEEVAGARLEVESESNTLSGYCQKASNFCVFRHF